MMKNEAPATSPAQTVVVIDGEEYIQYGEGIRTRYYPKAYVPRHAK
ncbi:hypothetical protein TIN4_97 [Tsukamurella phage TIN4]|uniref:Uncharacterized protein n=2 Tax=Tinduovirus TIN3 TaxID=1982571 RepID=A0A0K0N673_9CAUD|nr:hypothetical protein AVT54_gp028 [Tsukamurella phage TIN3]YP_009604227.1 hypothetical protein FDH87_gp028 [Tsukamurella phage TIN4]AKJ71894.1 hypothetical protein TIN3_97 [Tsukamurella phage TIN3]AKJ72003.1 hypothetical protein TIN4_97 [Tsukamurella phage TIN4]